MHFVKFEGKKVWRFVLRNYLLKFESESCCLPVFGSLQLDSCYGNDPLYRIENDQIDLIFCNKT
jgi:hypothetical protein